MSTAIRRGTASIAKSALSPCYSARSFRLISPRSLISNPPQALIQPLLQPFSTTHVFRQRAAEARLVEDEITDEVAAERPPSDAQIDKATQHGPVTRFKELGERGMVCPTIVKTLIEDMKLETMTQVQSLTINETLKGGDV